jgi:cyclopropane fatty-acyl-phospholipid synthase-like methyltransferase
VRACEAVLGSDIRHLDIGCAGGGLVWDFTRRGHLSVGLEGSDFSLREQRAAWRTIPDRLFTADICYPFYFTDRSNARVSFDVISAWELFEHIPEAQLPGLLKNITENLRVGGYMTASIATFPDNDETRGITYHHTVQSREWWEKKFRGVGLVPVSGLFEIGDFVRGAGNPTAADWDVRANPELGFHIVLRYDPATASA